MKEMLESELASIVEMDSACSCRADAIRVNNRLFVTLRMIHGFIQHNGANVQYNDDNTAYVANSDMLHYYYKRFSDFFD